MPKIDLTGIIPEADVLIKMSEANDSIDIIFLWNHEEAIAALKAIERQPMIKIYNRRLEYNLYIQGIDRKALAERIATTFELEFKLRVQRLVSIPGDKNKSARQPVESFLLM